MPPWFGLWVIGRQDDAFRLVTSTDADLLPPAQPKNPPVT